MDCAWLGLPVAGFDPNLIRSANMLKPFQVVVGNIGHVYDGSNYMQASCCYSHYIKASKTPYGRASGEPVTLFHNGEIRREYFPPNYSPD